jgi:nickel transport protein
MPRLHLIIIPLLLLHGSAEAHLLKLFAYVEGPNIHGSVYFAGGAEAAGAVVTVSDTVSGSGGQPLAKLKTDPQGAFSYTPADAGEYRLRADTGDGHQAEGLIRAAEFGPTGPDAETSIGTGSRPTATDQTGLVDRQLEDRQLMALVEQALARQIGPLRAALQRSDERARLSDILGGIGFIFGLAGIVLWWRGRRGGPGGGPRK